MTFKHKLSARLALMRDAVVLAALASTACERPVAVTTPSGDPVTQLVVLPQTLTIHPTQTAQLMAVAFTAAGDTGSVSVGWSVTGGSITDTSTTGGRHYGRFQAGAQTGTFAVIALGTPGAVADTAVVAVTPVPVAAVTVTPAVAGVLVGASVQLAAVARDSAGNALSGRSVTWASGAPAVATVSAAGLVTGVTAGSAPITATSEGKSDTAAITVTAPIPVAAVDVAPASATVEVGLTLQLTATPKDANGQPLSGRVVTWASDTTVVATVSTSGLVMAKAAGSATITATSEGQSGTSVITVPVPIPVASVEVKPAAATIEENKTVQLTATPKDANNQPLAGRVVTWASSNTAVASVSATGLVTGKVTGTATVTATSEGQSGTAAITVTLAPVASVSVTPGTASVQEGSTLQLTATPRDATNLPLAGRVVTWASSSDAVATVDGTGRVTGV
ncbi:MAG: Ig-like domain-containing protein, partial [Gemmatimonadales bacterium]